MHEEADGRGQRQFEGLRHDHVDHAAARGKAERIGSLAHEIAEKWGLEVTVERMRISEPAQMSPHIQAVIDEAARDCGHQTHWMNSGAGHDAQVLAKITEAGMIFVPSRQGRSHSPAEFTDWDQIENGANVLLNTLLRLSNE